MWILPSYSIRLFQRRKKGNAFSSYPLCLVWALNQLTDCYFCMVDPSKPRKEKNALSIKYPDIPSSTASVPHNTTRMLVPQPHLRDESFITDASSTDSKTEQSSAACIRCQLLVKGDPINPTKKMLELPLTKSNAEPLIAILKKSDLLDDSIQITSQKKRHRCFSGLVGSGGFRFGGPRGKTKKGGPLMTSSYSANRDNHFCFA